MSTLMHNIIVTPCLLVRVPIMSLAISLLWIGQRLGEMGDHIPGWRR